MAEFTYYLLDVFSSQRFGGNPLAVFPDAAEIPSDLLGRIAREMALSETAFVLPPRNRQNDRRVRIFTPAIEVPMAGHPTVGAAYLLHRLGRFAERGDRYTMYFEEGVGVIPVGIEPDEAGDPLVWMEQPLPRFGPAWKDRTQIAAVLSIEESDLLDLPLDVVTTGVPFLIVPLRTLEAARRASLRLDLWHQQLRESAAQHILIFSPETEAAESTVHTRVFVPGMGILEDPATGAASGPLGCYLVQHGLAEPGLIVSEQGLELQRGSRVLIEIAQAGSAFSLVRVGGQCADVGTGTLTL